MSQTKNEILVKTDTHEFVMKGRPCELSGFSFIPPQRVDPKERNYFNTERRDRYSYSTYDRLFHQDYGYNNKLHRDDREHAKSRGLTVNSEEVPKIVPTLASSEYGHRIESAKDLPDRKHVRIAHVQTEFYRRNGVNAQPPHEPPKM